jgi:hypothetical protein
MLNLKILFAKLKSEFKENQQSEGNIRQCGKENTQNAEKLKGKKSVGYDIQETKMCEFGLGFFLYKIRTNWVSYSQKAKERRLKTKQSTGKYIKNSKRMIRFWWLFRFTEWISLVEQIEKFSLWKEYHPCHGIWGFGSRSGRVAPSWILKTSATSDDKK